MVRAKLQLEPVGSAPEGSGHHARVVHEKIDSVVIAVDPRCECADAREGCEVEVAQLYIRVRDTGTKSGRGNLCLGSITISEYDGGTGGRQCASGLQPDAAGRSSDHRDASRQVDPLDDLGGSGRLCICHACSSSGLALFSGSKELVQLVCQMDDASVKRSGIRARQL